VLSISAPTLTLDGLHAVQCPSGAEQFPAANGQFQCVVVPHQVTTFFNGFTVVLILVGILGLICQVKIITKAGYSGWYILTGFVPILNFVMFLIFVFAKWPIQERLERAERGVGYGYPPPPGSPGSGGGPWGGGAGPGAPPVGPARSMAAPAGSMAGPAGSMATPAGSTGATGSMGQQASAAAPGGVAVGLQPSTNPGVIYCSWCGKERAVDAQAIHHCGSKDRPVVYCMTCGTALDGAANCTSCGTPATQISR
jgi:hypothetical protein